MKSIKKSLQTSTKIFADFDLELELEKLEQKLKLVNSPAPTQSFQFDLFPLNQQSPKNHD